MPNGDRVETPDYLLMPGARDLYKLDEKSWYARHLITNVLDVDVPMISAVNGPCNMHSEVPLPGDIVLASEEAYFQDASHFPRGQVPGDGQHVIWSFLAGHTRARYFLLTGMKLGAAEAKQWGVVNEVLAKDKLLDRGQRYEARLSKPYDDLVLFYDAAAPRAEAAIAYLNGLDINELPPDAERLLQLLYSMILISHAVNVFKQNRIPDSGAAFFDMVAEPAV
jgi:enoyl-CoA hydratase/carnithine racemase